jgi:hypothetical protein
MSRTTKLSYEHQTIFPWWDIESKVTTRYDLLVLYYVEKYGVEELEEMIGLDKVNEHAIYRWEDDETGLITTIDTLKLPIIYEN